MSLKCSAVAPAKSTVIVVLDLLSFSVSGNIGEMCAKHEEWTIFDHFREETVELMGYFSTILGKKLRIQWLFFL